MENSEKDGHTRPPNLPPEKTCMCVKKQNWTWNNGVVQNWEKSTSKAVYCHPAYLTDTQNTSCEMPYWNNHKLESRLQEK